mmetsp:Transcript_102692/g.321058  ORF Transcript_102692/g.321058 Transcript_102692/m.321058 type:complete len:288 (+) Transcript_102692:1-864(+)
MVGLGLCCRPTASGPALAQSVLAYLLMGGRHLDGAHNYQNHREVGVGIRHAIMRGVPREEIFVTTKVSAHMFGYESVTAWVPQALGELGLDRLDLVLLHQPTPPAWSNVAFANLPCGTPRRCRQETWMALERFQAMGLIRDIGVSNFGPRQLEDITSLDGGKVAVNQLEYHPWILEPHRRAVEWCHQHGVAVTAFSPFGSIGAAGAVLGSGTLAPLAAAHGKTPGQVLLRWLIQKNISAIPGTGNPLHMLENLDVFSFELSAAAMAKLDADEFRASFHPEHEPDRSE